MASWLLAAALLMPWLLDVVINLWLRAFTRWGSQSPAAYWDFSRSYVNRGFDRYMLTLGLLGTTVALAERWRFASVLLLWMVALFASDAQLVAPHIEHPGLAALEQDAVARPKGSGEELRRDFLERLPRLGLTKPGVAVGVFAGVWVAVGVGVGVFAGVWVAVGVGVGVSAGVYAGSPLLQTMGRNMMMG